MTDTGFKLVHPPIVEAILDIDCAMPPGQKISELEKPVFQQLQDRYPKLRGLLLQSHQIEPQPDRPPKLSVSQAVQALQFLHADERQLVQFRAQGFSFNRLAPYTRLDDYLPEIQRTWKIFLATAKPAQIRQVRLRYINRIFLPTGGRAIDLNEFLALGPQLPDETGMNLTSFLHQHTAVETATGNQVNILLVSEPHETDRAPIILDITASHSGLAEAENWAWLLETIKSLRDLKNTVFRKTLTERCLNLFQQP